MLFLKDNKTVERKNDKLKSSSLDSDFEKLPIKGSTDKVSGRWWKWSRSLDLPKKQFKAKINHRFEEYLINRLAALPRTGAFLLLWLILLSFILIIAIFQWRDLKLYYTFPLPDRGGVYVEGMVGQATNFNPLYATTDVDKAVARLIFAPLYAYDHQNNFKPVLAAGVPEIGEQAQSYTITLRDDLRWHDGQRITSDDVVFTIQAIKDPQTRSPLRALWKDVSVNKVGDLKVTFTLSTSFVDFSANLTLLVVPEHILASVPAEELIDSDFSRQPVGSGSFVFKRFIPLVEGEVIKRESRIELSRNDNYFNSDKKPLLDEFHFWLVPDIDRLSDLFSQGLISGAYNLNPEKITLSNSDYEAINLNLMTGVFLFFKNSSPWLNNIQIRKALVRSLDVPKLLATSESPHFRIYGPLLPEHQGYHLLTRPPEYNLATARTLLSELGWQQKDGRWHLEGQKLQLTLTTQKNTPYADMALEIKRQLERAGISVDLDLRSADNVALEVLQNHNYGDLLIYGLNLGGDPDVYSYWHSSQIGIGSASRLNLSEYRSGPADKALEAGRSRLESNLRSQRYEEFQKLWLADLPALPLYRFQLKYYTLKGIYGPLQNSIVIQNSDRFWNIENWAVIEKRQSY